MISNEYLLSLNENKFRLIRFFVGNLLSILVAVGISACGDNQKKPGQTLARVEGREITILQLNEELSRANIPSGQVDSARKELLESLINRELLVQEAMRRKLDRSPIVLQEIERAKAQIIANAYVQNLSALTKTPTSDEVNEYYVKHPELFSHRRQFEMKSLAISTQDMSNELKSFIASAKSLQDISAWLAKHGVPFKEGQSFRNSEEFPAEMAVKLQTMSEGNLFIVNEVGTTMIVAIENIKEIPISLTLAEPQILSRLIEENRRNKLDLEIKHLRSVAKIEYLDDMSPSRAAINR